MDLKKAELIDSILTRFKGNVAVYWNTLYEELEDNMDQYYVIEENINYLIGEDVLVRVTYEGFEGVQLTEKGYAIHKDPDMLGFVSVYKKERNKIRWTRTVQIVVIITFVSGGTGWLYKVFDETPKDQSNKLHEQLQEIDSSKIESDSGQAKPPIKLEEKIDTSISE